MAIRTGILCIPQLDEGATAAVVLLLRRQQLPILVIQEAGAGSQRNWVEENLRRWCDEDELDLILTIGGTMPASGPSGREITPEVTQSVIERSLPGFAEAMRAHAQEQTPLALLDRGICGIRGQTLLLNLPEGAAAAVLFLEAVVDLIPAALAHLHGEETAPTINDEIELVDQEETAGLDEGEVSNTSRIGLDAEEFAKFLLRGQAKE